MNIVGALIRAKWEAALSYRFRFVTSVAGLLLTVVPLFFISEAVQPVMADAIANEGGETFGFLLIGLAVFSLVSKTVSGLPEVLNGGIRTGTLEALLATPASMPRILVGLSGFDFLWTAARSGILILAGWTLGADIVWAMMIPGLLLVALIVIAHVPFALLGGAMILFFRTARPLPGTVLAISGLLGGVYYPTHVIPSWLETVSAGVPLAYGLRALRRLVLDGSTRGEVLYDIAVLGGITVILLAISSWIFGRAMRFARSRGTLAQY